ncbi:MAG: helix-turn-helix domain-containing protein [Candidatus Peregrinibacteria bacterium]|nr:helix-turn-helix domain-containing protein [Candidatus Peregrinibacteria bacterium]MDZ4244936.1 helix-turn-helix domain-containing protein [Candidatus Gracilibacteria bacterium]
MLQAADLARIKAQLKQFGCSDREAQIYVKCLQMGPATVQEISRKLRQNRVTVHSAIEQLIEKGFVTESRRGKKRLIVAEEPDVLYKLIQQKKNELTLIEANVDFAVKLLQSVRAEEIGKPTVKLYEDVEGFKRMLEESLTAKGELLVFTYVDLFSQLLDPDYLEDYFVRRAAKGIHTRLIFPPCDFAYRVNKKAKQYKIRIRLLPANLKWRSGFFAWNDSVSLKSFTEGRLTTTIIENRDIAHFMRNIVFELIWNIAEPV